MKDEKKTKKQLIEELVKLRRQPARQEMPRTTRIEIRKQPGETARLYTTTIDSLEDILHVVDADLRITLHNKAFSRWCRKLGLRPDSIGRTVFEVFPFLPDEVRDEYQQVFETGKRLITEEQTEIKDQIFITETRKIPVKEDGKIVRVTTIIRDITERKRAEKAQHDSERRYRAIVHDQTELICRYLPGWKLTFVNEAYCKAFDMTDEELIGTSFVRLIPREDQKKVKENINSLNRKNPIQTHEHSVYGPDGKIRWQRWTNRAIFDKSCNIVEYQSVGLDITARKRAEDELQKHRDELEKMVVQRTADLKRSREQAIAQYKGIPVPTYTWQKKGNNFVLIDYSDEAYEFTTGKIVDFVGLKASEIYRADPEIRRELRQCYLQKTPIHRDMWYRMKSTGENKYLSVKYAFVPPDLVLVHTEDITQRKRDEEEIIKFKTISDRANYGTAISNLDGQLTYINETFARMHGYDARKLLGEHLSIFHSPEQLERVKQLNKRLLQEGSYVAQEVWHKRKDGTFFPTLMSAAIIKDDQGEPAFLTATAIDITERKRHEEELRESKDYLQILFDYAPEVYYLTDASGKFIDGNKAAEELSGYSKEELIGKDVIQSGLLPPEEIPRAVAVLAENAKGAWTGPTEFTIIRKTGNRIPIEITSFQVKVKGRTLILNIGRDISERKQANEKVRASEKLFRDTFNLAAVGITHISLNGQFLHVNPRFCNIVGYTPEELLKRRFQDITHPEDIEENLKMHRKLLSGGTSSFSLEKRYISRDGLPVWVNISAALVRDDDGNPDYIISVTEEIGDRKWTEDELSRSWELHKIVFEYSPEGYFLTDTAGRLVSCNLAAQELTGLSRRELQGARWLDFFVHEDHKKAAAILVESTKGRDIGSQELLLTRKDGSQVMAEISAFRAEMRQQTLVLHIVRDITRRKKDEKKLLESEKRYRDLFNGAAEGILVADIKTRTFLYCNPALSKMLGYTEEEIKGMKVSDLHPKKALKHVVAEFEAQARGEKSLAPQIPCLCKDGEIIYADIYAALIQIDGKMCNVGFFTDITERKLVQERLRESERTFRDLMNAPIDSAILVDPKGYFLALNEAAARKFGKPAEELIGKRADEFVPPEVAKFRRVQLNKLLRTKKAQRYKDERQGIHFDTNMYPILDAQGKVSQVAIFARDITEEVTAKTALQKSEQKFRELTELLPVVVFEIDLKGNIITTNRAGLETFGYTQEEIDRGLNVQKLFLLEEKTRILKNIAKKLEGELFEDHEYTGLRKDGTTFPIIIFSSPILQDKKPVGLRGIIVDISDRKRVEEELRTSEQRYRELTELLPQVVFEIDPQGNLLSVNQYWFHATGYTHEDLEKGINVSRLVVPEDAPRARQTFGKVLRGEVVESHQYTAVRKDGSTYPIAVYLNSIIRDGRTVGLRGVVLDISDIKFKEEQLRASEEKFRGIAENVADIIFLTDRDGRFTYLSPAIRQILDRDPEKCIRKPFHAILHNRDIAQALNSFNQMIRKRRPWIQKLDMVRKDRTVVCTELSARVIIHKGQVVGAQGIIRDISERLKSQQAVEQSEAELKNIVNLAPDAIMTVDLQGVVTSCNAAFLKQFGYSEDQILGRSIYQLPIQAAQRRAYIREMFTSLISSKVLKPFVLQWMDASGKARHTEIHAAFLRSGRKKTGVLAILRDVTKRKKAEKELIESEGRWRSMAENIPSIILITDRKGTVLFLNHTLSGVSIKKRIGTNIYDYAAPEHKQTIRKCCERVWKTGSPGTYEIPFIGPNGKTIWFESRVGAIKTANQVTALAIISTDITERKREEQIQRTMYLISTAVHTSKNLDDLYKTIHRALEAILKTKNFSISLYDREKDMISLEYHVDEKDRFEGRIPAGKTLTSYMLSSEKPLLVTHREIRKLKQARKVKPIGAPTKVWMGVPLRVKGKPIGALVVNDYRNEQAFDEQDLQFLELVSDTIALSIQHKQLEISLSESEKLFRTVAEHSLQMIYVTAFGQIIFANKKCEKVFGYKRNEYYSADFDFLTLMTPESRDLAKKNLARHRNGQEVPPTEYTMITRRGRQFRALNTTKLITYNDQPAILGILSEE